MILLAYNLPVFGEISSIQGDEWKNSGNPTLETSLTKKEELENAAAFLKGIPVEPPEEVLRWLKSKNILKEDPIVDFAGEEQPVIPISLRETIAKTLRDQWKVEIAESEVTLRYGKWQEAAGPFDPILTTFLKNTMLIDPQQIGFKTNERGNISQLNLQMEKLTRIGTRFSLGTSVQKVYNPSLVSVVPSYSHYNQSSLNFQIDQPILRRFFYNQEAVTEIVSSLQVESARNQLVQTMAQTVLDSILAYWDLVAAEKIMSINEDAEKILDGLTSATYRLVEKNNLAASELNEQIAELARSKRDLVASKQDVYAAYNALLLHMGERRCEFSDKLPHLLLENFILPEGQNETWDIDCLLQQAYLHRGDLIAARIAVQEADLQLRVARNNILPSLDVILGAQFRNNTIDQNSKPFFSSYYLDDAEKDLSAELRFSIPFWNDKARGERTRRREERCQAYLHENELWSSIYSEIATTLHNQIELVQEIHYANEAANWYEIALRDEILRTKAGYGSLFVVIDFENRFRRTLIERVNVQKQYAQNIAHLLFLTGTLVLIDTVTQEVTINPFQYEHLLRDYE